MNPVPADLVLPTGPAPTAPRATPDVVELTLLLPSWQIDALEEAARDRGVTVGAMIRRCLGELLRR